MTGIDKADSIGAQLPTLTSFDLETELKAGLNAWQLLNQVVNIDAFSWDFDDGVWLAHTLIIERVKGLATRNDLSFLCCACDCTCFDLQRRSQIYLALPGRGEL